MYAFNVYIYMYNVYIDTIQRIYNTKCICAAVADNGWDDTLSLDPEVVRKRLDEIDQLPGLHQVLFTLLVNARTSIAMRPSDIHQKQVHAYA